MRRGAGGPSRLLRACRASPLGWAGLANLYFWIDRHNGIGGFWATQILPCADPATVGGSLELETAAFRDRRANAA